MKGEHHTNMIIITNNEKVRERYGEDHKIMFIDGSYRDVLIEARNRVHQGQKLLTHPLMGSVKPNETPFKSVAMSEETGPLSMESLQVIEHSIATYDKFMEMKRPHLGENASESLKDDFREIDLSLLASALG